MKIKDRNFEIQLSEEAIIKRVADLATTMNTNLAHHDPVFIAILNGSFMFASDIMKNLNFPCQIQFIKVASYKGTKSSGNIETIIGLNQNIEGRNVVILEDIIDTGLTIEYLRNELIKYKPSSLKICCLLFKPKAIMVAIKPDYIGFEVSNSFLVGYGLDYDGYGRNLKHIYVEI